MMRASRAPARSGAYGPRFQRMKYCSHALGHNRTLCLTAKRPREAGRKRGLEEDRLWVMRIGETRPLPPGPGDLPDPPQPLMRLAARAAHLTPLPRRRPMLSDIVPAGGAL